MGIKKKSKNEHSNKYFGEFGIPQNADSGIVWKKNKIPLYTVCVFSWVFQFDQFFRQTQKAQKWDPGTNRSINYGT